MKKLYENPLALVVEIDEIDCLVLSSDTEINISSVKKDTTTFGYFGDFGF